jgi:site-specific recombinase XerD
MNYVEPIRSAKKIAHIKNLLKGQSRFRDLLLFTVGINTALRVSDLLSLRIGDFVDQDGTIRQRFWIREAKRNKRNDVIINDSMTQALLPYRTAYPTLETEPTHSLFFNTKTNDYHSPISRKQAWKIITTLCHEVGLQGNYGTHTLRKTWGYHARQQGVDLALIMHKLNHSSLAYTKRYLGITNEELEEVSRRLNL